MRENGAFFITHFLASAVPPIYCIKQSAFKKRDHLYNIIVQTAQLDFCEEKVQIFLSGIFPLLSAKDAKLAHSHI